MKNRFFILVALLLMGLGAAVAQNATKEDLNKQVPIDKKVIMGKLDNGLTYYIRANKKPENRVQFRIVTNAGSILEDDDQQGLAHFLEHMAFNGTKHFKGNEMISELQKAGVQFGSHVNAYTSFDETVYFINTPNNPEMIEMGMKILDGWAGGLLLDGEEIEKERGVVIEEWRGNLGAGDRMRKKTFPIMLKGSRYADRLPIGQYDILKNFKHESIRRFYKDWYRPDLQAIIIVGDIDPKAIEAKIKEYFNKYEKRVNPRPRTVYNIPDNKKPLVAIGTDKEATSNQVVMFWKHKKAPTGTVGNYREGLVRQLANGIISSRFSELCEKSEAPMLAADGGYEGFIARTGDAFALVGVPKEGQMSKTIEVLLTEMRRADQHGFLQSELDRQKDELLSGFEKAFKERDKTDNNAFATEYTNHFLQGEVIPGIMREYKYAKEFVPEITLEEVNKLIAEWITDENLVVWIQANDKEKIPTEKEINKIISNVAKIKTTPWVDNYKEEPLFSKQLADVKITNTKKNDVLDYTEYTLPNGVRFVVKKTDFKEDQILVNSYSLGGMSLYEDNEVLTATLAATVVDQGGIAGFNNSQLNKKLKGTNLSISPSIRELSEGLNGNCSPKDFETLLQLTYLYFDAPRKDKDAFDRNMTQLRTQAKLMVENPQFKFMEKLYKTAYPENKRLMILPTEEQMNAVNFDRLFDIYKERFSNAGDFVFVFVGNISDEMIPMIAKYLGNLPANSATANEKWVNRDSKFASGIKHENVMKGTDNQGIIAVMGETKGFEPTKKNKLTTNMLGEALSISVLEKIREDMGSAYSPMVQVSYEVLPEPQLSWLCYITCDPEQAPAIEKAFLGILEKYMKEGPDEETLTKVKKQLVTSRETNLKENSFWMSIIYGSYFYNIDNNDLYDFEKRVNEITAADIRDLAKKYIHLDNFVSITLKPEETK